MRVLAASLLLATANCSIFFQTSDLQSDKDAGEAGNASDGGDGSTAIDGTPGDAPSNEASGRWCKTLSPAPVFCDDFDDQGPFAGWTNQDLRAGGTVVRDSTASRSAPNSLLTDSPGSSNPGSAVLFLQIATTVSKLHYAYDMRIDVRDPQTGYAEINYVKLDNGMTSSAIYMRAFKSPTDPATVTAEAYLADGGVPQHDIQLAGNPQFGGWRRVDLDLDLAQHLLTVTIDGAMAGSTALESNLYVPSPIRVETGIGYTGSPSGEWRIRYDNVTIDWH